MQNLINDIVAIVKAPFIGELDLTHLFLIVGVVIIFAAAWVFILNHIKLAAAEVL
jgi:hypothetical protein